MSSVPSGNSGGGQGAPHGTGFSNQPPYPSQYYGAAGAPPQSPPPNQHGYYPQQGMAFPPPSPPYSYPQQHNAGVYGQGQQQQQPQGWGYQSPVVPTPLTPAGYGSIAPPAAVGGAGGGDQQDYYRGFYEGVIRNANAPNVGSIASWVGPLIVNVAFLVGPIWYIRRKYAQSMASAAGTKGGKADASKGLGSIMEMMQPMKPKQYRVDVKGTTFDDIIGIPEAKEDLKQYVDFLSDSKKFTRLGARLPKGCLLTGKPGTGKTLLARAVAGEAKTPFFTCSGADFIEIFGGSGPKRVRELFAEAKQAAPCVVFIDEIDAIGSRSGGRSMGGGSSEENRTINQLLAELDGLTSNQAIVVIAATNYPEAIDKALLREGRFDRKVNIPMPDREARLDLFKHYLNRVVTGDPACKPKPFKIKEKVKEGETAKEPEPVNVKVITVPGVENTKYAEQLADRTPGVSPAQISTIVNEAALTSAIKNEEVVSLTNLQEAIDDVLIGKKHRQRMSDSSLRRTAYHECGHAMMAWMSPLQKDVIKISIIPRGRAGGYTQQVQDEAMAPQTDEFLFSQLCVLLGGRVAEKIIMGDVSTGALDDLQRATKIAMDQLLAYGMSKEIGNLAFKPNEKNDGRAWMNYSEQLHSRVEAEARALVDRAFQCTEEMLLKNKDKLDQLAKLLLEKKELMRDDVCNVLGQRVSAK